ncbi:MAG TPA: type II CAAX endopeptidase family protein, partial [Gemmatimonadales bacterium]|nr:type II CAAX endopeptidase family protein [Gemmatimonadales bacterium]
WWNVPPFARLEWTWGGLAAGIAATAPLLVGLGWSLHTRWQPMVRLIELVEERIGPLFVGATRGELALVALLAGLGEEALFRGVLQDALAGRLPVWAALLLASILFGVAHWVTATYAMLATLVGIYLGALYHVTGNLLAPIAAHALYDLVALSVLAAMKPAPGRSVV